MLMNLDISLKIIKPSCRIEIKSNMESQAVSRSTNQSINREVYNWAWILSWLQAADCLIVGMECLPGARKPSGAFQWADPPLTPPIFWVSINYLVHRKSAIFQASLHFSVTIPWEGQLEMDRRMLQVLMVAEKPNLAKALSGYLSQDRCTRGSVHPGRSLPLFQWDAPWPITGEMVHYIMTSTFGHINTVEVRGMRCIIFLDLFFDAYLDPLIDSLLNWYIARLID